MEMNGTTVIARTVDEVFDYVVDTAHDANWRTGVIKSGLESDGPAGPGTMGYTLAGKQKAKWRVTSYEPGQSVDWVFTSGPLTGRGGYRVMPVEGGTQFTLVADVKPTGWFKLLGPVFGWIGRRQNQNDVEKLREILESAPEHELQA